MKIQILLSCITPSFNQNQRDQLAQRFEWEVVNKRLGRVLLDVIGERADLQTLLDFLTAAALDPIVIVAFRQDTGQRVKTVPLDEAEWLKVAPNMPNGSRPTAFIQNHGWLGWGLSDTTAEP